MHKSTPLQAGQKFGRLTVISLHHKKPFYRGRCVNFIEYYLCKCDCGNTKVVCRLNLGRSTNSCGCLKREKSISRLKIHGKSDTRIYSIWCNMIYRCYSEKDNSYIRYGGRGITVCDEWKKDFMSFYKWALGNGYKENLTIDRIDNNGNYEPSNCQWVTMQEQGLNRRNNRIIEYKGEKHCITEWAQKIGVKPNTLLYRFIRGWSVEKSLGIGNDRKLKKMLDKPKTIV